MIDLRTMRMIAVLLALIVHPLILAQERTGAYGNVNTAEEKIQDDGIQGLIIDNTVTFIGRGFYDAFALAWLDQHVGRIDNISINERPTARSGSRVWVEYNRQRLFEVFLSPVRSNIESQAHAAAISVARRVEEVNLQRLLFANPDIAPDEF